MRIAPFKRGLMKQIKLNLNKGRWGGRRTGSGRTRKQSKGVSHRTREKITNRLPAHINLKYRISIRNKDFLRILKRAILNSRKKGLRIIHYSVQSNHIHFIIEAENNRKLESGMRSLTVTMAKGLARGKVQLQRFHLHVLKSLRETKNAVRYVVFNEQKHTGKKLFSPDGYSSFCRYLKLKIDYCVTKLEKETSYFLRALSGDIHPRASS